MENKTLPKAKKQREDQLQFLRFLAFLNVFILHGDMWNCFAYPTENGGHSAVSLFFLLSGMLAGYAACGKEQKLTLSGFLSGMWKKVKKIYPLYLVTTFYFFLLCGAWPLILNRDLVGLMPYLKQLCRNLLMIQVWSSEGYYIINSVSWFCAVIVFLYLFNQPFAFLLNKVNQKPNRKILLGVLFGICLGAELLYCWLVRDTNIDFWQYVFPLARLGSYLAAMVFGFAMKPVKNWLNEKLEGRLLFTVLEAGTLLLWFGFLLVNWSGWTVRTVIWLLPNFLVLGVFLLGKGYLSKLFRWKPLVWLGDISFECYMVHYALLSPFVGILNTSLYGCVITLGVYLLYTITVAAAFHRRGA